MKRYYLLLIVFLLVACAHFTGCNEGTPTPSGNTPTLQGLKQFTDCNAVEKFFEKAFEANNFNGSPVEAAGTGGDGGLTEDSAQADAQTTVEVEQGDIVKSVGNRLYIANDYAGLLIYDVAQAAHSQQLARVTLDITPREIYVTETRVSVIGTVHNNNPSPLAALSFEPQAPQTKIQIFETQNPQNIQMIYESELSGYYQDSRKIGDQLYVVTQQSLWFDTAASYLTERQDCTQIYAPERLEDDTIYNLSAWELYAFHLQNNEATQHVSIFGGDQSQIGASPERLYFTHYTYNNDQTEIFLFPLNDPNRALVPPARNEVPGVIVSQFSLDEHAGHFRIASTTNRTTFGADDNRNYITIFSVSDNQLVKQAQLDNMAPGESITAVRFIENTAFVTTFVTKDPLFTVDLSKPQAPKILGELDVPGFPRHLHVSGDLLISIGTTEEFWGEVILSLFDISDLVQPILIQQLTLQDTFSSEALWDHRAFSFFEDRQMLALPLSDQQGSTLVVYAVNPSTGFQLITAIDHTDLLATPNSYAPTMRRSLEINNSLFTISDGGLKSHSFIHLETELFGELFPDYQPFTGCYYEGSDSYCIDDIIF